MKTFEKIAKRYALTNSYYKHRQMEWPDTLAEIYDYLQQHGELSFRYEGDNWSYDALCERLKRRGVYLSQYLTPDRTAWQMAALAVRYFDNDSRIVDACCGTGQLTRALIAEGMDPSAIVGFDMDGDMIAIYERLYPTVDAMRMRFEDIDFRGENIIPILLSRRRNASRSSTGLARCKYRETTPSCSCRTVLSTSSDRKPCRKRYGTLSFITGHLCRSRSYERTAVPRSSLWNGCK